MSEETERAKAGTVVVVVAGPAGSGKTTASRLLARQLRAVHLDKDALTRPLLEVALRSAGIPAGDRESDFYVTECRTAEYETLTSTALDVVTGGLSVVLDAPFGSELASESWWTWFAGEVATRGARVSAVLMRTSPELWRTRIEARGAERDRGKLAAWEEFCALVPSASPAVNVRVVTNDGDIAALRREVTLLVRELG